jgi:hypothetical protein
LDVEKFTRFSLVERSPSQQLKKSQRKKLISITIIKKTNTLHLFRIPVKKAMNN